MEEVYYFDSYSKVRDLLNVQGGPQKGHWTESAFIANDNITEVFKNCSCSGPRLNFWCATVFFSRMQIKKLQLYSTELEPHCIIEYLEAIFHMFPRRNILHRIKYVFEHVCVCWCAAVAVTCIYFSELTWMVFIARWINHHFKGI